MRRIAPPQTKFSASEINKARRETRISVLDEEQYDGGTFNFGASYTDGTLQTVLDSLIAIRDSIPKQYRSKARCNIDSSSGYEGSHYAHIEVSYDRPETDDEVVTRLQDEATETMIRERNERAQLEQLKSKYA